MSDPVDDILNTVIRHEGGYQNMPEDKGNWYKGKNLGTKYGITPAVLSAHLGRDVTQQDMKSLSESTARAIYRKEYVDPIIRNLSPSPDVLPHLVDMNINHGYGNMAVIVQRAAGAKVDGKVGPGTRKAIQSMDELQFRNNLVDQRKQFYSDIIKRDPTQQKFQNGWMNRAESWRP